MAKKHILSKDTDLAAGFFSDNTTTIENDNAKDKITKVKTAKANTVKGGVEEKTTDVKKEEITNEVQEKEEITEPQTEIENSDVQIEEKTSETQGEEKASDTQVEEESSEVQAEEESSEVQAEEESSEVQVEKASSEVQVEEESSEVQVEEESSEVQVEEESSEVQVEEESSEVQVEEESSEVQNSNKNLGGRPKKIGLKNEQFTLTMDPEKYEKLRIIASEQTRGNFSALIDDAIRIYCQSMNIDLSTITVDEDILASYREKQERKSKRARKK